MQPTSASERDVSPASASGQMLEPETARAWVESWDRQQATFFDDREERFQAVLDVLEHTLDRPDPLVLDLGCGPGSLTSRLLARFPQARVIAVDMDPLLLGLARAVLDERASVQRLDLRDEGWLERLALDRAPDAVVSSTALHWLDRPELQSVLRGAAAALRPSGVLVDADHTPLGDDSRLVDLESHLTRRSAERYEDEGALGWQQWWDAVAAAPELADLMAERATAALEHEVQHRAVVQDYLDALTEGGCRSVGVVRQVGDDRILVGLR